MSYNGPEWSADFNEGSAPPELYMVHMTYEVNGEIKWEKGVYRPYFSEKGAKSAATWYEGQAGRHPNWGNVKPVAFVYAANGFFEEIER